MFHIENCPYWNHIEKSTQWLSMNWSVPCGVAGGDTASRGSTDGASWTGGLVLFSPLGRTLSAVLLLRHPLLLLTLGDAVRVACYWN